jgi:hypothetical protein
MLAECSHVMPSGLHCQSPVTRGSSSCYFHARPQRPARPRQVPPHEVSIEVPDHLDFKGTCTAIHQVTQAILNRTISLRRAGQLLHAIDKAIQARVIETQAPHTHQPAGQGVPCPHSFNRGRVKR